MDKYKYLMKAWKFVQGRDLFRRSFSTTNNKKVVMFERHFSSLYSRNFNVNRTPLLYNCGRHGDVNYSNSAPQIIDIYSHISRKPVPTASVCCIPKTDLLSNLNHARHFSLDRDSDPESKELTVWSSVKEIRFSPIPALTLGLFSLVPLALAPFYMVMSQTYMPDVALAQIAYGATAMAFLGGVRWGAAIAESQGMKPSWFNLGYGASAHLVAWLGMLLPDPFSLFTLMAGLSGVAYLDIVLWGYPLWFKGLRFILTFVALLTLWTTFMCKLLLKKEAVVKEAD